MKLNLAQNIRKFRKEKKLTQEQLAEVMGVTLGAVYKWESGQSIPELNFIVEMADFFETSIDVLLGYEWHNSSADKTLAKLKKLRMEKCYTEGASAARKALRNYPNHFTIVYECAQLFYEKAEQEQSRCDYEIALKQLGRACDLMAQNTDESINELLIRNQMAQIYFMLGRTDTCLRILKRYNFCGINDAKIGCILADSCHQAKEAKEYLTESFGKIIEDLDSVVVGFTTVFWMEKDYASIIAVIEWLRQLLRGQTSSDTVVWFDKYDCVLLAIEAEIHCVRGEIQSAKEKLIDALKLAKHFDKAKEIKNPPLLHKMGVKENHYSIYGETALEAIERRVQTDVEIVPQIAAIWEQVKKEGLQK